MVEQAPPLNARREGIKPFSKASLANQQAFKENLALFSILVILISVWIQGPFTFTVAQELDITLYDLITPFVLAIWIFYALTYKLKLNRYFLISLLFVSVFFAWIVFEFFRSPQPFRAFTLVIIFIRDLLVFFIVGTLAAELRSLNRLTGWIFYLGLGLCSLAVILYLNSFRAYTEILASPERWHPKMGYWADIGGMIRLSGTIGNPVRFACYMTLSLFCGMANQRIPRWLKYLALFIISATLFLTFTRGLLIALPVSILILIICGTPGRTLTAYFSPLLAIGGAVFLLSLIPLPLYGQSGLSLMASRFGRIESDPRLYLWAKTLSQLDNPVLGSGLRASEHVLSEERERLRWVDNSYLMLISDTGFIGLIVFLWIFVPLIARGFQKELLAPLLPYTHSLLILLVLFFFYFLIYEPFLWLVSGIIAGPSSANIGAAKDPLSS